MINVNELIACSEELHFKEIRDGALLGKFEKMRADHASLQVLVLAAHAGVSEHRHPDKEEFQYVLSGTGEVEIAGEKAPVAPGSLVFIPTDVAHSIRNVESRSMKVLEVYAQ